MQKSKTTIAAFVIILFASSHPYLQAQTLDSYQFFPADVGDRWEYTVAGPDIGWTIVRDSIDIKDSSRFIFFRYPPTIYGANYRIDKNYNVFLGPQFVNRHLYKLNSTVGESWIVYAKERVAAKVLDIAQAFVFGKLTTVKTIGFYRLAPGDTTINENSILDYWEKLAYGFGLISRENGAIEPMLLRGCRINGITYGTVDVEEELKIIPSEFVLYQNYPNPFNPTTVIDYQLPVAGHVTVRVFDLLGREIVTLVNEEKQAGKYEVKFDGSGLASGIYFYQLTINKTTRTRTMKMILQK